MKKNIFLILFLFIVYAKAQTPFGGSSTIDLYFSKQTGAFTQVNGSYSKTSDEFESGNCGITTTGPIKHWINPSPNYGPNQTITWNGGTKPDIESGPAPGNSSPATLTGDWSVIYSKPGNYPSEGTTRTCDAYYTDAQGVTHDPHGCGGYHTLVNKTGSNSINYVVHSIQIVLPDVFTCVGNMLSLAPVSVYPEGGTIEWTTPFGNFSGNPVNMPFQPQWKGAKVVAVYTVHGLTYSDTAIIDNRPPEVTINVPVACVNGVANLTATCYPPCNSAGGIVTWTLPDGSTVNGATATYEIDNTIPEDQQLASVVFDYNCEQDFDTAKIVLARLTGFELPCCVDSTTAVEDIAKLFFDGPCHPKVKFDPEVINPNAMNMLIPTRVDTIRAYTDTDEKFATITLVNPNCSLDTLKEWVDKFKEIKKSVDKMMDFFKEVQELGMPKKGGPVEPPCTLDLGEANDDDKQKTDPKDLPKHKNDTLKKKEGLDINFMPLCCKDDKSCKVTGGLEIEASIGYGVGLECAFPIPIPYVPPIVAYIELGFEAGIDIALVASVDAKCPPVTICVGGEALITVGGSVALVVLKGGVTGKLALVIKDTGAEIKLCYSYPPPNFTVPFTAKFGGLWVIGTIEYLWGLFDPVEVEYELIGARQFTIPDMLNPLN